VEENDPALEFFFFFQAEDGIRDTSVTGVQTCALPIFRISDRLKLAPAYALDYVLFHEAIHLQYFDHGAEFTEVLGRFEDSELASAYLDGYEAAERSLLAPVELKNF